MSVMYVDRPIQDNCWNLRDSYGEICVWCGCCSKDKKERHKARLETVKQWKEENDNFCGWDDDPVWRWRCTPTLFVVRIKKQVEEDEFLSDLWWDDSFNAFYLKCRYIKEFCD